MKKFLVLALLIYAASCSNPEDKATGNPDSTSFNQSGNEKNLNTTDDAGNQSHANNNDTSAAPSTSKQNVNSSTQGTNRTYTPGGKDINKKP